jgi:hypothetical protein
MKTKKQFYKWIIILVIILLGIFSIKTYSQTYQAFSDGAIIVAKPSNYIGIGIVNPSVLLDVKGSVHIDTNANIDGDVHLMGLQSKVIFNRGGYIYGPSSDAQFVDMGINIDSLHDLTVMMGSVNINSDTIVLIGTSAGTMTGAQPYQGVVDKKVWIYLDGFNSSVKTYTFPIPFTYPPAITYFTTGTIASVSYDFSQITLSTTGVVTGWIKIEGY